MLQKELERKGKVQAVIFVFWLFFFHICLLTFLFDHGKKNKQFFFFVFYCLQMLIAVDSLRDPMVSDDHATLSSSQKARISYSLCISYCHL